ncbi:MAG: Asp23/Gls24 family envelope stress response protein [Clostridiales bacterium]|jgi:uncharacterized alkaline shock family protein YloU|nr:Asp23/Gls24 family envelope stress response protein [Clostridiales bacterium]
MAKEIDGIWGKIIISNEVIAKLAGIAATECFGIVGMVSSRLFADGLNVLLGRDDLAKGVEIIKNEEELKVKVNVVVGYGIKISMVAQNVIDNVKYVVEKHTGLKISHVDVTVQGVKIID